MMEKLLKWFMNQTDGAKTAIVLIFVAFVVVGVLGVAVAISNAVAPPAPSETVTVAPEDSPAPEDTKAAPNPEKTPVVDERAEDETDAHGEHGDEQIFVPDEAPFTVEQLAELQINVGKQAVLAECLVIADESMEDRQARLGQFFSADSEPYNQEPFMFLANRKCQNPTFHLDSLNVDTFQVSFHVSLSTFSTFVDASTGETDDMISQERKTFDHVAEFVNGSWVIVD